MVSVIFIIFLVLTTDQHLISPCRSYKELLAKCNDLGRREARCCEELENANKKIKKLKVSHDPYK